MPNRTFHGQIMHELANMPWPWKIRDWTYEGVLRNEVIMGKEDTLVLMNHWEDTDKYQVFISLSPERLARVEVEKVEDATWRICMSFGDTWHRPLRKDGRVHYRERALTDLGISREDYENVVKRLGEMGNG